MRLGIRYCLLVILFFVLPQAGAYAQDVAGASDHPEVGRYQGSVINYYSQKGYDELRLPTGPLGREQRDRPDDWQVSLEGKTTSIRYVGPASRSALEIIRNHQRALEGNGFEIVFTCRGQQECSPPQIPTFWEAARAGIGLPTTWNSTVYLVARRDGPDATIWVGMIGVEVPARGETPLMTNLAVTIVETVPMETDQIAVIEASELEQALVRDGKIAIYGIHFDFDSADIQPQSAAQIEELAGLLSGNEALRVLIVGHTDGQGAFDYNLLLSQRRAQAVVDALANGHGIASTRLQPAGAGMVSPVATNRTEEDRARNRRVEIVEMMGN